MSSEVLANQAQARLPSEVIEIHQLGSTSLRIHPHSFCVEIADEPEEWTKGLMFRKDLGSKSGMLFLYPDSRNHTMWMKNTPLALDMFFIDKSGTIVSIAEHTTPYSHDIIGPKRPVVAVLELVAGSARKFGIKIGHSVHHRTFGQKLPQNCTP